MSTIQSNGLYVCNYILYGKHVIDRTKANILFTDNYAKYFSQLGLDRYDMMILTPLLLSADPLIGVSVVEPFKHKKDAKI